MKGIRTEGEILIEEMGEKFKPYISICVKQRLRIEEVIPTFNMYLETRKINHDGHRIISKFSFEQFILQQRYFK